MRQEHFMDRAIELSAKGMESGAGGPFGCVIVRDGKILAEAYNEVLSSNDPTAHAEVLAIRRACHKLDSFMLDDCELYTSCEPCPMCLGAIYWARIERIYYANTRHDAQAIGFDDAFIYHQLSQPKAERAVPMERIYSPVAEQIFVDWQELADKLQY